MANQQLFEYIKAQRIAGVTKPDLEKALATAGWSAQDIAGGFAAADGVVPPAPAAPVRPLQPVQPISMAPMSATTMQMNVQGAPRRRSWLLWSILAVLVVLAAAAGAAYMFVPSVRHVVGYYMGGMQAPVPAPADTATTTATKTYTNAQYGFSFTYPSVWFQSDASSTASSSVASVGVSSHDPSQPYSDLSQPDYSIGIEVYPLDKLHFAIDPSAWIDYSTSTGQWVRSDCTDFNSGCKKVTKTATSSNITVGGMAGYQMVGYNPGFILVPLKSGYGLSLFLAGGKGTPSTIDPVLQQILNSFTVGQ